MSREEINFRLNPLGPMDGIADLTASLLRAGGLEAAAPFLDNTVAMLQKAGFTIGLAKVPGNDDMIGVCIGTGPGMGSAVCVAAWTKADVEKILNG